MTSETNPLILAHGESGTGKTGLIENLPNVVVFSSSPTIVRLRHKEDIHVVHIESMSVLEDVVNELEAEELKKYDWHCFDSLSLIAESALLECASIDRKAYFNAQNRLLNCLLKISSSRVRPTYCTAWTKQLPYSDNQVRCSPSFPGQALGPKIPHLFTNILHLHCEENDSGETMFVARSQKTPEFYAKDESGNLPKIIENPDLNEILKQIRGED